MYDGNFGKKAYYGECCCACLKCGSLGGAKQGSVSLMAQLKQDDAKERLKLIKAESNIRNK